MPETRARARHLMGFLAFLAPWRYLILLAGLAAVGIGGFTAGIRHANAHWQQKEGRRIAQAAEDRRIEVERAAKTASEISGVLMDAAKRMWEHKSVAKDRIEKVKRDVAVTPGLSDVSVPVVTLGVWNEQAAESAAIAARARNGH